MRDPRESEAKEIYSAARKIVGRIKGLKDLDEAVEDMFQLEPARGYMVAQGSSIYAVVEAFRDLNNIYHEFQDGLPTTLTVPRRSLPQFDPVLIRLRAQLNLLILPRMLELPAQMRPKKSEGPIDFLRRVSADAIARKDYLLAARARAAEELTLSGTGPTQSSNTGDQARFFAAANNKEAVGDFPAAVSYYESCLTIGTDLIPPKVIGDRLTAIKLAHPEEFQKGLQLYQSPKRPAFHAAIFTPGTLEIFPKAKVITPSPAPTKGTVWFANPFSTATPAPTPSPSPSPSSSR
jgi:hypothetical protein